MANRFRIPARVVAAAPLLLLLLLLPLLCKSAAFSVDAFSSADHSALLPPSVRRRRSTRTAGNDVSRHGETLVEHGRALRVGRATAPRHCRNGRRQQRAPFAVASSASEATPPGPAASAATMTGLEWQDSLASAARPLSPTPLSDALPTLRRDGVVRVASAELGVDFPALCDALRTRIVREIRSGSSRWEAAADDGAAAEGGGEKDLTYVPGTRLRFVRPVDVAFSGVARRHDLLLPVLDGGDDDGAGWTEVMPVFSAVAAELRALLGEAAEGMLPRFDDGSSSTGERTGVGKGGTPSSSLEVVELASLLSCHGSTTQGLHGDYRRYRDPDSPDSDPPNPVESPEITARRIGRLPPRLVTFVALQDVPTVRHGATGFITGTHNARAHDMLYGESGIENGIDLPAANADGSDCHDPDVVARRQAVISSRRSLLDLSTSTASGVRTASQFRRGDVLIYDASVLHWGGPNLVPENDRAILYFGVARPGAAGALSGEEKEVMLKLGFELGEPVLLDDIAAKRGVRR